MSKVYIVYFESLDPSLGRILACIYASRETALAALTELTAEMPDHKCWMQDEEVYP